MGNWLITLVIGVITLMVGCQLVSLGLGKSLEKNYTVVRLAFKLSGRSCSIFEKLEVYRIPGRLKKVKVLVVWAASLQGAHPNLSLGFRGDNNEGSPFRGVTEVHLGICIIL